MSRIIKFRAWGPKNLIVTNEDEMIYDIRLGTVFGQLNSFLEWRALAFMQFTGLYDKNGVEIYESDIVRYCYFIEKGKKLYTNKKVEYIEVEGSDDMGTDMIGYNMDFTMGEVIGNIYEHPNLLK